MSTAAETREWSGLAGVVRALGTGLMSGVLGIIVLLGIAAIVVPAVTGATALTVMTSSMEPDYPAGTLVVVRPTEPEDIAPGDVLTYQVHSGEPTLVTHRVTEQHRTAAGEALFVTQGDANTTPDPGFVREVQIRGTVWYAIPWVGWVTQVVTGEVRAIAVPIVAGALGVYAVWMIVAGLRERQRDRAIP
ncbi:signal peptidase I [Cellulosimicrobium funkei]|nr:signal peptidase I [Cellulosimicrobium funkei]